MKEHQINQTDSFILGWYPEDTRFCDDIIRIFEDNKELQNSGPTGENNEVLIDIKDSIDVRSHDLAERKIFLKQYEYIVWKCCNLYYEKYPYSANPKYALIESYNLQKYNPGGGYKVWHSERGSNEFHIRRHLVFMTYLNDVSDCGETEFFHQNLKIKPEKGLTLIWPADWTHTHRGIVSQSETKYIATGWLSVI